VCTTALPVTFHLGLISVFYSTRFCVLRIIGLVGRPILYAYDLLFIIVSKFLSLYTTGIFITILVFIIILMTCHIS